MVPIDAANLRTSSLRFGHWLVDRGYHRLASLQVLRERGFSAHGVTQYQGVANTNVQVRFPAIVGILS
jgi:hypothetical protein